MVETKLKVVFNVDKLVQADKIIEMIGDDQSSLNEFWHAAIISFVEYKMNFVKHMHDKDLAKLREAGHKIKPAAAMLGLDVIIKEYEHAKQLLKRNASDEKIQASIAKVKVVCDQAIHEFKQDIVEQE